MGSRERRSDILFTFTVLLLIYVAWRVIDVLLLIYISALFAVVLAPAINLVRRLHVRGRSPGRGTATLIIFGTLLIAITVFVLVVAPPIINDMQDFAAGWPVRPAALTARIRHIPFLEDFTFPHVQQYARNILGGALGLFRNIAGGAFGFFYFLVLLAYFIVDGERVFYWGLSMFPRIDRERLERTLFRAEARMRHWLVGQTVLMLALGTSCFVAFGLLHLKYFYALAVIAGLLNIIPIVGPTIAVVMASLVALIDSPMKLLGVLIFFAIYQQFETAYLTPRIMKASVNLPPLAVIVALSLGGAIAGVLGALIAVPTAALCAVLIDEYVVKNDDELNPEYAPAIEL